VPGAGPCLCQDAASPLAPLAHSASNESLSLPHRRDPQAGSAGLSPCLGAGAGSPRTTDCLAAEILHPCLSFPAPLLTRQRDDSISAHEDDEDHVDRAVANPRRAGRWLGPGCSALLWLRQLLALRSAGVNQVPPRDRHPDLQGHPSTCTGETLVPSRGRAMGASEGAASARAAPLSRVTGLSMA